MGKEQIVNIPIDSIELEGALEIPENSKGLVIFAHGSGSSRHSSRNNFVARILRENNLGTLLFDLLSEEEDMTYENRFNIELLTQRLILVAKWIQEQPHTKEFNIGLFGASTGAAAALKAAARMENDIKAVVSRGGRPDLAKEDLDKVKAPTLLIVGGDDFMVIDLNKFALNKLKSKKELTIIPGATHLFEEPGTLELAARHACNWFAKYLK